MFPADVQTKPTFQPAYVNLLSPILEQQERFEEALQWAAQSVRA